ncbi:beta strand repeat-containing protein, partial [Flaviaesturariibacter aridisoli]
MRKLYFLLCLLLTSVAGFSQALMTEPFDYTPDPALGLSAQSANVWKITNGGDSILVDAGSLSYPGLPASTGNKVAFSGAGTDYYRNFGTQTSGTVYASFLLNVTSLGTLNATGGYFFVLTEGTSSSNHASTVWVRLSGTGYNIGINSRTTAANTNWLPTVYTPGTTYLVVVSYNIVAGATNDFSEIWVNPALGAATAPAPNAQAVPATADLASVGRVMLRQDATNTTPPINVDEIRVGLDWASVTPSNAGTPTLSTTVLPAFGNTCVNTTAGPNSFTLTGSSLTATDVVVGPLAGYSFSSTSGGTYSSSLTITPASGAINQDVFVKFTPTAVQSYSGNIPVSGGGATATSVTASGSGVAPSAPTVATAASSGTNSVGTTLNGTLSSTGCANVTSYGFIYSTTTGFDPATSGTTAASSNLAGTTFSTTLSTLNPSTTYYYVAFATNSVGTTYSTQSQFTTTALPAPTAPVATAATNITGSGFTANWNAATGTTTGYFLDVYTQGPGTVVGGRLAGWDIPTNNDAGRLANTGTAANLNTAELLAVGAVATYTYPSGPSGSQSTYAVSTTGWDAGVDTKYWMVAVNTTGASNITVSSLQASSNTGPKDWKIQYRVGNSGSWIDIAGGAVSIATSTSVTPVQYYGPSNLALPADAANQPLVQIRWVVNSTSAVNGTTVVSGGTSRISSVYVKGDYPGTVNTYLLQNANVGTVTSYNVTGLSSNTTYYYVVRADNGGSTSANSNEIQVVTTAAATPSLSATVLADFGNICLGSTAGPNNFTITGTDLTGSNVTVNSLPGFTFSTTAGGTYTSTLTLTPSAGSLSQTVYVHFAPAAVQNYDGDIIVSGGGATAINVHAAGAGINTPAIVTTNSASGVTTSAATLPGSITAGCSATTAYGIVYSTTSGFNPATTGTTVTGSNLSGGNFTVTLSSLAANTTYYYVAYATNGAGTTYGTQQSFTTNSNPSLSAGALSNFSNTCINTASAANSFTVTGSNLTGDVSVNALAGYTYSTTSGGTYTNTLTLSPTAGALNTTVFVKFTPTAVQSYNGNIQLTGGGATAVNVAASGAGVNTPPSVSTTQANSVTATSATLPGGISFTGCSNVTAYGFVYSTSNGFNPATTGTNVPSTNLASPFFSADLSGLTPGTTYYYVAYATNAGGTSYGGQGTFTTLTPALSATALTAFGNTCINTTTAANSFTVTGSNLTGNVTVNALAGYTFSTTSGGTYTSTLTLTPSAGALNSTVFVKFTPTAVQSYNGNISVSGGGATAINVAASGAGINTPPSVPTAASSAITTTSATVTGNVATTGCSTLTAYGVIYSTTSGFNPATSGTTVNGSSISAGSFPVNLTGLTAGTTYYYVPFVTNAAGTTVYGTQQTFATTSGATIPTAPVATAATAVTATGFTANWNAVTGATGYFLDVYTLGGGSTAIAGWDMAGTTDANRIANQGNANNINIATLAATTGASTVTYSYPAGPSALGGTNPQSVSTSGWDNGVDTKYWMIGVNT